MPFHLTVITLAPSNEREVSSFKVAKHNFQVPMPNSSLLLNYLCFGARFFARVKITHRSIYSCIYARVCAVAMAMGLV